MPAILKQLPLASPSEAERPSQSALVAAVIASVEECTGHFHNELSDREFRELVRARGRSCDEALLELRRAALVRSAGSPVLATGRRRTTTRRPLSADAIRVLELERENQRLRLLVAGQQLDLDGLRGRERA